MPRPLLSTLSRQLNRALQPLDRPFLRQGNAPPPLFILGPPRSGTTLLYQLVTQGLDVAYLIRPFHYLYGLPNLLCRLCAGSMHDPEPCFESRYGAIPGWRSPSEHPGIWYRWLPQDGETGHYLDPQRAAPRTLAEIDQLVTSMSGIVGRPMVFKNVYLSLMAGVLARLPSAPRFLRIRRDRLEIAESLYRARQRHGGAGRWWSVRPPGYRDWLQRPLWQQVCWQVHRTERLLDRQLQVHPEQVLPVCFETLCDQPRELLGRIGRWLASCGYRERAGAVVPERFVRPRHPALAERCEMEAFFARLDQGGDA